ncbi:MAG: hypothetical protein RLZZ337_975 [Bacteroidota bacterium]|jgi:hypothetical protein
MRILFLLSLFISLYSHAQDWKATNHPNNGKKAINHNGIDISEFVYTEISELSEGKAYVAMGQLYAYIDTTCNELTEYIFAEANNFRNGYAVVGDSFYLGMINAKMQVVVPLQFVDVRMPKHGLIVVQTPDQTWGVLDTLGRIRLPFIYDLPPQIIDLEHIIVRKEELYGVVNDCNDIVFNTSYQYISTNGLGYKSGKHLKLF